MPHPAGVRRHLPQPDRDEIELVAVLHALADAVRLKLLANLLADGAGLGGCSPRDHDVRLSASTLSHHWRVLREAGLTDTVVDGRRRIVSVRVDDLRARFPGLLDAVLAPVLAQLAAGAGEPSADDQPDAPVPAPAG